MQLGVPDTPFLYPLYSPLAMGDVGLETVIVETIDYKL